MKPRSLLWKRMLGGALAVLALGVAQAQSAQDRTRGGPLDLGQRIEQQMDLARWTLQEIAPPVIPPDGGFDVVVELDGHQYQLDLWPWTARALDFRAVVVEEDGSLTDVTGLCPPKTYRGDVRDVVRGEVVGNAVATCDEGKLWTRVRLDADPDGVWALQPLSDVVPGDTSETHVTYHSADLVPHPGRCGTDDLPWRPGTDRSGSQDGGSFQMDPGDRIIDIAFECDFEYMQFAWANQGKKAQRTIRNAENLMLDVEVIYERDCDVTFEHTFFSVRKTRAADPYSGNDAGTLLNQFGAEWNSTFATVRRDIAHMLSGKNTGGILGIAWLDVLCSGSNGYGFSWTTFSGNDVSRAGLTAHEIGHNAAANHCDGAGDCWIMCSGLGGCANDLTRFGSGSQNSIRNAASSAGCLATEGGPTTLPFFDDFESGALDPDLWSYSNGANIAQSGDNEPSGVNSVRLNTLGTSPWEADDLRTAEIDMTAFSTVTVSFYYQQKGMEAGEDFVCKRFNKGKNWKKLLQVTSDGVNDPGFTFFTTTMPANGIQKRSRLRFQVLRADESNDRTYVDDVSIVGSAFTIWDDSGPQGRDEREGRFRVVGAPPHSPVVLFGGFGGLHRRPFDPHRGELDLIGPILRLGELQIGADGLGELRQRLPADLENRSFYVQALVLTADGPRTAPPILVTVKP